ncbi:hypothetical protein D3C84_1023590 [compost metagenome]
MQHAGFCAGLPCGSQCGLLVGRQFTAQQREVEGGRGGDGLGVTFGFGQQVGPQQQIGGLGQPAGAGAVQVVLVGLRLGGDLFGVVFGQSLQRA